MAKYYVVVKPDDGPRLNGLDKDAPLFKVFAYKSKLHKLLGRFPIASQYSLPSKEEALTTIKVELMNYETRQRNALIEEGVYIEI